MLIEWHVDQRPRPRIDHSHVGIVRDTDDGRGLRGIRRPPHEHGAADCAG